MGYDPNPAYPVVGGEVEPGYDALARAVARGRHRVLAVDGPAALPWERFVDELVAALAAAGLAAETVDVRRYFAPWDEIERRTASSVLPGDPVFGRIFTGSLASLFDELRPITQDFVALSHKLPVTILFGPGSALFDHDALWYADVPKRLGLEAVRKGKAGNLGQPAGEPGSEQRLLFVDWPLLDRHKQELIGRLDRYVDVSAAAEPRSLEGAALRSSLRSLAGGPFRVRPSFLPGPWGGQWLRRVLEIETEAPNLAWSYELITPESGVLLGGNERLEVGFELLMAEQAERILGEELARRFGVVFPIRFDYLDTFGGGHLSIQCHPSDAYARTTFGLPFTQHESYYVLVTSPDAKIFLGLREDADLARFREEAEQGASEGRSFRPEDYLQAHPAERHRLYLIPGGTPHASGAGNVVLEISATPYLYTLRFYDWLRRDLEGALRPVHLEHAFANLDPRRRGEDVPRRLIQEPSVVRRDDGAVELSLGSLDELFFRVHRLDFEDEVEDETSGGFHVLNLVEGEEVEFETSDGGGHALAYAETVVMPAAVGKYRIRRRRGPACKVVKAFVAA